MTPVKASPKSPFPVEPVENQYTIFTAALRKVLQVSHSEMQDRLAEAKKAKASKPRPSVSSRASRAKD